MWTSLPLLAALALVPAQQPTAATLTFSNIRTTHGQLGGVRQITTLLPGDGYYVAFDIEGIAVDPVGRVSYTMAMEVTDKAGKPIIKQDPTERKDYAPLGGGKIPARAYIDLAHDQPPGEYTMKVSVSDKLGGASKSIEQKFTVGAKEFGIVRVHTTVDAGAQIQAPTTGIVGQTVFVQFMMVGFGRDAAMKQPSVVLEMLPLDETGKPTIQKPNALAVDSGVPESEPVFTVRFLLPLTRVGKFTVQLKATDKVTGKVSTFNLPITVLAPAN